MEQFIAAEMTEVQNPMKALNSLLSCSVGGETVTDDVIATDTTRYWNPLDKRLKADEQLKKDVNDMFNSSGFHKSVPNEMKSFSCIACSISSSEEKDSTNDIPTFNFLVDSSHLNNRHKKEGHREAEKSKKRDCFENNELLASVPFHHVGRKSHSARAGVLKYLSQDSQEETVTTSKRAVSARVTEAETAKNSPKHSSNSGTSRSKQTSRRSGVHRHSKGDDREGRKKTVSESKRALVVTKSSEETTCKPTGSWKNLLRSPFTKRQRNEEDSSNKIQSK